MGKMTSKQLEFLLDTPKYKTKLWTYKKNEITTKEHWDGYYEAQRCNGITEHADLLNNMAKESQTLPTQQQYIERGTAIARKWWKENKQSKWHIGMMKQFQYRLSTSYISQVIEIHTKLRLSELYPEARVFAHDFIDYGLAVDIVMEDREYNKRYYIHILKDSKQSREYLAQKEKRDKIYIHGQWESYSRNFTGHTHLFYKNMGKQCKDVNGMPLFTDKYLMDTISYERVMSGEDMGLGGNQLKKFENWLIKKGYVNSLFSF